MSAKRQTVGPFRNWLGRYFDWLQGWKHNPKETIENLLRWNRKKEDVRYKSTRNLMLAQRQNILLCLTVSHRQVNTGFTPMHGQHLEIINIALIKGITRILKLADVCCHVPQGISIWCAFRRWIRLQSYLCTKLSFWTSTNKKRKKERKNNNKKEILISWV